MPSHTGSVLLLSGISAQNVGDDAMLIACALDLKGLLPEARITVLAETPANCEPVRKLIGVPIEPSLNACFQGNPEGWWGGPALNRVLGGLPRSLFFIRRGRRLMSAHSHRQRGECREDNPAVRTTIQRFAEADLVFDVGGANLNEIWKPYFYEKCFSFLLAGRFGKPLILSGQSMEPMRNVADRALLRTALNNAQAIFLREPISERYIRWLGVSRPRVRTTGDDALTLPAASVERVSEIMRAEGVPDPELLVGVQFRDYLELQSRDVHKQLAKVLDGIAERLGARMVMIPMHYGGLDERTHWKRIQEHMAGRARVIAIQGVYTPMEIKGLIGRMTVNLGISYHFFIFSASMGVPIVAPYRGAHYAQKMQGLTERFGLKDAAYALDSTHVGALVQAVERAVRDRSAIAATLRQRSAAMRGEVRQTRRECVTVLGKLVVP